MMKCLTEKAKDTEFSGWLKEMLYSPKLKQMDNSECRGYRQAISDMYAKLKRRE